MDDEAQALLLFTNRLLLDVLSIAVDTGRISRADLERIIDFSAGQVLQGAPQLKEPIEFYTSLTKSRLPAKP
ncbi:MAG: hypothetical protein ACJ8ER_05465 [Allosphingosinicella sp.]